MSSPGRASGAEGTDGAYGAYGIRSDALGGAYARTGRTGPCDPWMGG